MLSSALPGNDRKGNSHILGKRFDRTSPVGTLRAPFTHHMCVNKQPVVLACLVNALCIIYVLIYHVV